MPVQTGILDEFTEVEQIGRRKYALSSYTRSDGARGPFRNFDGTWGGLKDLITFQLSNHLDMVLYRGGRGIVIRPFVRINGQDRYLVNLANQFPGVAAQTDYERHGLKYALGFNDPTGRVTGFGFEFNDFGPGVSLGARLEPEFVGMNGSTPEFWDVPVAIVRYNGFDLFEISSSPMLKIDDPEWRPYRDGNKVRVDLAPAVGKRIEFDPAASFGGTSTVNGFIVIVPISVPVAAITSGTTKTIGWSGSGSNTLYRIYDRFDISALPADATATLASYRMRLGNPAVAGSGAPDNAVWRVYSGWNVLDDPLATSSYKAVENQSGRYQTTFDDETIQNPSNNQLVFIDINAGWIRGNGSDLHDVETEDISTYSGSNYRTWLVQRTSTPPYLYIEYTLPPTGTPATKYTPHAGI